MSHPAIRPSLAAPRAALATRATRAARAALAALLLLLPAATAQAQADIAGSADHPLFGRYAGAYITAHAQHGYDELWLPDRVLPAQTQPDRSDWMRPLDGRVTRIRYVAPPERSTLEVMRNHQRALESQGFRTLFWCRGDDCVSRGRMGEFWEGARGGTGMPSTWGAATIYLLAERDTPEGRVTIAALAVSAAAQGDSRPRPIYAVTIVEGAPMQTDMIESPRLVEAGEFETAFAVDGRIAVYGITFDIDSDALRPEAGPQIDELARVLRGAPDLAVIIVGHTDSTGGFDHNLRLSQRRAQAVVSALTDRHGIDAARLTPAGAGMVAPVATNRTDAGRARNRRVEIVERIAR